VLSSRPAARASVLGLVVKESWWCCCGGGGEVRRSRPLRSVPPLSSSSPRWSGSRLLCSCVREVRVRRGASPRGSPCPRVAGVFCSGDPGFVLSSCPLRIEMRGNGGPISAALIDCRVFAEAKHQFVGILFSTPVLVSGLADCGSGFFVTGVYMILACTGFAILYVGRNAPPCVRSLHFVLL
jgi:hypothetical protein